MREQRRTDHDCEPSVLGLHGLEDLQHEQHGDGSYGCTSSGPQREKAQKSRGEL